MTRVRTLLIAGLALLVASPCLAQEEDEITKRELQERLDKFVEDNARVLDGLNGEEDELPFEEGGEEPEPWNPTLLTGQIDLAIGAASADSNLPGRDTGTLLVALEIDARGRYGHKFNEFFPVFLEGGLGFTLGGMGANIEDARTQFASDRISGIAYGVRFELGAGFAAGPFSFSAGLATGTTGALLEDEPGYYVDSDNNGTFERNDFTLDYGFWATYLQASYRFGPAGEFVGTAARVRYYPSYNFNFRDGEIETSAISFRFEFQESAFGSDDEFMIGIFGEFTRVNSMGGATPNTWQARIGLTFSGR